MLKLSNYTFNKQIFFKRPLEGLFAESSGRSNHRFLLITLTYHALYEFYFDEDSGNLIALQLLWRSISDVFVTRDEMIGSLWRFSRDNIFMNKRTEMIFDNVNLIHPEITVPGRRSLQHLCRCFLRQRLADNHQLPDGTQNLGLPTVLKEYIDLEMQ
ncbi:SOCS box domain-containing protein [Nephila pilipes]|uniref:SOCS box domain-containing protein n=1 Tax=Nephila pilipes TaxID=299642 RepID=A0A8X6QF01_NEPPI|nr:SOCS box domain-containing protein [Nephila pilipes]